MANAKKAAPKITAAQQAHMDKLTSTAARVRYLASEGLDRGDISRVLNIRYQWVRNVLITPLKGK
jgi:aminoglycoside phosphotransferase